MLTPDGTDAKNRRNPDGTLQVRHVEREQGRLRHAMEGPHYRILLRCLTWPRRKREDHIIPYPNTLLETDSDSVETRVRRRRVLFVRFVARVDQECLPRKVVFGEVVGGKGFSGPKRRNG